MLAAGAELWHKGTMETGLDLASREALLAIIAEQQWVISGQQGAIAELRQRVESLEARLSGGGPGARMPGHKPAARRKKPRKKRQHGSPGRGWNPPGGWSTPRSLAPNAILP